MITLNKSEMNKDLYASSVLNIQIIEGQNIEFDTSYVSITFKEQVFKTGDVEGEFPVYNQAARITGVALGEEVFFTIIDSNNDENFYTGAIVVDSFVDQKIHDMWMRLSTPHRNGSIPRVHLQFNYIFSKAKICEDAIRKWDEYISIKEQENQDLERDLELLYSPFDFLSSLNSKPSYFTEVKPVDKLNVDDVYEPKFHLLPPKPRHPILNVALGLAIILLLVAIGSLDYRNHILIDLFVVFFVVTMYYLREILDFNLFSLIFIIINLCASLGIEIAWFIIYSRNWWKSVYIDDGSLISFRRYTYYNSIFSMILKALLAIVLIVSIFMVDLKKNYDTR